MPEVKRIKCGNGNCYIVKDGDSSILVDTARTKYREQILAQCRQEHITLILLTHTHMDHCQNAGFLSEQLQVPIAIAREDESLIADNMKQELKADTLLGKVVLAASIQSFHKDVIPSFQPEVFLKEGDSLESYGIHGKVIALPGHTDGSIGIDVEGDGLVVGDALMNMFYPMVSMLYHNREEMLKSAERISGFGERIIYFGHGKPKLNRNWVKGRKAKAG